MFLKLNQSCPLLFCPVCCAQGSAAWPGPGSLQLQSSGQKGKKYLKEGAKNGK